LDRPFESALQIPKRRKRPIRKDWSFSDKLVKPKIKVDQNDSDYHSILIGVNP
jgi:hypothetical protein